MGDPGRPEITGSTDGADESCMLHGWRTTGSRIPTGGRDREAPVQYVIPPYVQGLTLRSHPMLIEAFYVVEGTLAFTLDRQTVMASAGALIVVASGVLHTFFNPSATPASVLRWSTSGNCEQFVAGLVTLVAPTSIWPTGHTDDMSRATPAREAGQPFL